MRFYDLKQKEVINISTCRSLGYTSDFDVDVGTGHIFSLVVPGPGKFWWFLGREYEYVIPWNNVVQIGADIILVDVNEEEVRRKTG